MAVVMHINFEIAIEPQHQNQFTSFVNNLPQTSLQLGRFPLKGTVQSKWTLFVGKNELF